jgi:8-oxo-dGTP pyrophosphatase MutT (NUDIX family)
MSLSYNMHYQWNKIPVRRLYDGQERPVSRAGVVPFCGSPRGFLFMTPRHKPGRTRPKDQIAKGGRLVLHDGEWKDLRDRDAQALSGLTLEPVIETAMREGREELGLLPDNVIGLYDLGPASFRSERKKRESWMHLFAAHVASRTDFEDVLKQKKPPVSRVRWLTLAEFRQEGREDHIPLIEALDAALSDLFA